ncbi:MAG: pilus assembly protein PilB, partial [Verrucomicrobiae bacterium]|nr:pilus assembly protein PilB [Verrucomicrobiae bacterium]
MADVSTNPLLALIRERGLADDMQLEEVMAEHSRTGRPVSQILLDYGIIDTDTQLQLMAEHLGTEVVTINELELTPEVIDSIPAATARMYQCLPVGIEGGVVKVALVDPLNPALIDELGFSVGKEIRVVVADPVQVEKLIRKFYPEDSEGVADLLKQLGADEEIAKEVIEAESGSIDLSSLANEAPIVKFVNLVLYQAIQDRAS